MKSLRLYAFDRKMAALKRDIIGQERLLLTTNLIYVILTMRPKVKSGRMIFTLNATES